ncbi:MAG: hypothetical protein ACRDZT_06835, partial [Acidimicrobiales bacterium]
PQTLMHAILTLHEKVRTGELTRRVSDGTGAGIHLGEGGEPLQVPGWVQPQARPVRLGTPK